MVVAKSATTSATTNRQKQGKKRQIGILYTKQKTAGSVEIPTVLSGAPAGARTPNLLIRSQALILSISTVSDSCATECATDPFA